MIRCLVVDDEPIAADIISSYIQRTDLLKLSAVCHHAIDAFRVLHEQEIDLIFLDIRLPGITGLDFLRSLKSPPAVILTTAYSEYALAGFELEVIDYLLKPVTYERFERALLRYRKIFREEKPMRITYSYFKVSGRIIKFEHDDIRYAQSLKDYIIIYTAEGSSIIHMTMKYLSGLLPADQFIRVHRSFLVNKKFIRSIGKSDCTIGDEKIPVGENYRTAALDLLNGEAGKL
jgi:DNA-binding LytR/AlgR family response regulator